MQLFIVDGSLDLSIYNMIEWNSIYSNQDALLQVMSVLGGDSDGMLAQTNIVQRSRPEL